MLDPVLADPDDDDARLVYADWLEERGDARAAFLRLDTTGVPSTEPSPHTELDPDWVALIARRPVLDAIAISCARLVHGHSDSETGRHFVIHRVPDLQYAEPVESLLYAFGPDLLLEEIGQFPTDEIVESVDAFFRLSPGRTTYPQFDTDLARVLEYFDSACERSLDTHEFTLDAESFGGLAYASFEHARFPGVPELLFIIEQPLCALVVVATAWGHDY